MALVWVGDVKDVEGGFVGRTGEHRARGIESEREDGGWVDAPAELDQAGAVAGCEDADEGALVGLVGVTRDRRDKE